jgi:hypothetical protein
MKAVYEQAQTKGKEAKSKGDSIGFLKIALEDPPVSSENEELKFKSLSLVHEALQPFTAEKLD